MNLTRLNNQLSTRGTTTMKILFWDFLRINLTLTEIIFEDFNEILPQEGSLTNIVIYIATRGATSQGWKLEAAS